MNKQIPDGAGLMTKLYAPTPWAFHSDEPHETDHLPCTSREGLTLQLVSRSFCRLSAIARDSDDVRCHDRSRVGRLGEERNPKRPNRQPGYSPCIQSAGCSQARPD